MPSPQNHIYNWLSSTLKCYSSGTRCYIAKLPPDILLDEVFFYLKVEDVVRLRQTNRAFYVLSHEPVIWRRFLELLHIPRPQLRPTFRYNHESSNYDIELLVTRSCAVDRAWRRGMPEIVTKSELQTRHEIVDLKLLPGGKFLVASVKDKSNYRFFIHLYVLDDFTGSRLLARLPTPYELSNLQAKYMDYMGLPGIMIAFTRTRLEQGGALGMDCNDYSHRHNIDGSYPLIHEVLCVHVRLDNLEGLLNFPTGPDSQAYRDLLTSLPSPFEEVFRYESPSLLTKISLFEHQDPKVPCLTFIEDGAMVSIVDLHTSGHTSSRLVAHPAFLNARHVIEAIRPYPGQTHRLLVVRTVYTTRAWPDALILESYDIPTTLGSNVLVSSDSVLLPLEHSFLRNFTISDPDLPLEKMAPDHPDIIGESDAPPTLWVFAEDDNPPGLAFFHLQPVKINTYSQSQGEYQVYQYVLEGISRMLRHCSTPRTEHVLPGTERSLIYMIDPMSRSDSPMLFRLRRFVPHDYDHSLPPVWGAWRVTDRAPKSTFAFTDIPKSEKDCDDVSKLGGLAAITWDENSGRICLAARKDEMVRIYDFCEIVPPQQRLAFRWRQVLASHNDH